MLAVAVVLVVVGLGFEAGYVPAHFWIPDVYQGATVPVAAFLSVVPKIAAVLALARLVTALEGGTPDLALLVAGISLAVAILSRMKAVVRLIQESAASPWKKSTRTD